MARLSFLFRALWLLVLLVAAQGLVGQNRTRPQGVRTQKLVYTTVGTDTLALDLYQPIADEVRNNYLIIYVHGGGFSGGRRDDQLNTSFGRQLSYLGYNVASISYRLTAKGKGFGCERPAAEKLQTFRWAVEDIYAATRFLRDHFKAKGVDSLRIVLAGSSAGAESVLHAVYWPNRLLAPPANALPGYRYAGLISMAGALADTSQINRNNIIPTLFFHGTDDNLVPFGVASHHSCPTAKPGHLLLYGPEPIVAHLNKLDAPYFTLEFRSGRHEWNYLPMRDYLDVVYDFLENDVLQQTWRQARIVQKSN
jgi:poly(3-hydroxybutyrate) depolymerase